MTLWACFVCASRDVCEHREPELVAWLDGLQRVDHAAAARAIAAVAREESPAQGPARMPPASARESQPGPVTPVVIRRITGR